MYKRILVPLDGSQLAEQILPHVEALVKAFGSTVVLLRVVTAPQRLIAETAVPMPVGAVGGAVLDPKTVSDLVAEEKREAEAYLSSRSVDLMGRVGAAPTDTSKRSSGEASVAGAERRSAASTAGTSVPSVQHEHPEGDAADVIVERARTTGVDLIAMTTHGRGGLGRLIYGSVAEAVLRHAPCPVLLVRSREE